MPDHDDSHSNTTFSHTFPMKPLDTYLDFSMEDDTLIVIKKVWNRETTTYDNAVTMRIDGNAIMTIGERLEEIEAEQKKIWMALQGKLEDSET